MGITQATTNYKKENSHEYWGIFYKFTVKDINASKEFYEKLGLVTMGGDIDQKW